MSKRKKTPATMSEVLRQAIADSGMSFNGLGCATGVKRQSLVKFARGEQSLRLDMADKLAVYFGLKLQPTNKREAK